MVYAGVLFRRAAKFPVIPGVTLTNFVPAFFFLDELDIWLVNPMAVSLGSLGVAVSW